MLNDLKGYCEHLTLFPIKADEKGIYFKCVIKDKFFSLLREPNDIITLNVYDDTIFNAFVHVLRSKYISLVLCRRNVKLLGDPKNYNYIQFVCKKETKLKSVFSYFEKIYLDLLNEREEEKVGIYNE